MVVLFFFSLRYPRVGARLELFLCKYYFPRSPGLRLVIFTIAVHMARTVRYGALYTSIRRMVRKNKWTTAALYIARRECRVVVKGKALCCIINSAEMLSA